MSSQTFGPQYTLYILKETNAINENAKYSTNILSCYSVGSKTQQHRGKVRLYSEDPGFRSGQDSSYGSADDTICGDALL